LQPGETDSHPAEISDVLSLSTGSTGRWMVSLLPISSVRSIDRVARRRKLSHRNNFESLIGDQPMEKIEHHHPVWMRRMQTANGELHV
jgi:hypothetical protein